MNKTRTTLLVDAFADEPMAGNPAGVLPDAEGLSGDQMGAIAGELGASETAFLLPSGSADRRVRYFTPETEVDLCGHATIASHAALYDRGVIDAGEHSLETEVGVLDITVEADGTVWMTQDDPEISPVDVGYERVGEALGIDPAAMADVGADLPLARATTGLPFLVVPVNFIEHLSGMDPDMGAIEDLSVAVDVEGVYAFTFDALESESTLHGRMFAPRAGVPEDPVTGTASGAVGAYLRHYGAFDRMPDEMIFEQGHFVDRPGRVFVTVDEQVRIGGRAVTVLDGDLVIPGDPDDDIIEA